jgi:hypothetical protein
MKRIQQVLAFDCGTTILGVLDVHSDEYTPYRHHDMKHGARRLREGSGAIVSFNGKRYDFPVLARLLGLASFECAATHYDMLEISSLDRWPPSVGTNPILGSCLTSTYEHYFGATMERPPVHLRDDYEINNWQDCYMAAKLWERLCSRTYVHGDAQQIAAGDIRTSPGLVDTRV